MDERRHTAIHEAGHAVIGRALGLVLRRSTIEADKNSSGHSIIADPWDTVSRWGKQGKWHRDVLAAVRGRIITFMAGRIAEEECIGTCPGGDEDDCYQINLMLGGLLPADADFPGYAERLRSKTRGLVRRHRAVIERVADKLEEHGRLTSRQIEQAIKGARRR